MNRDNENESEANMELTPRQHIYLDLCRVGIIEWTAKWEKRGAPDALFAAYDTLTFLPDYVISGGKDPLELAWEFLDWWFNGDDEPEWYKGDQYPPERYGR